MGSIARVGAVGMLVVLSTSLQGQSVLQITSPTNGTVVYPGHVVGVIVSASGLPLAAVTIIGWNSIGFSEIVSAPPYQFAIDIPRQITPGPYLITAVGSTSSGLSVDSDPVSIDVERPDSPQKIATDFRRLELQVGDQIPIRVIGTYSDGSVVDLNKSTQTTFVSESPGIATVSTDGWVTAVASGSTRIIIDGKISVPVTVEPLIRIRPTQATLKASQTEEFVARVTNPPDGAVTWSLHPEVGSVANGLYTAPAALDSQQTVTLVATSVADPTLTATAAITLSPAASVDIVPTWAVLYAAQTQQFAATTSNAGTAGVKWSISPSGAGTISSTGLYTAPNSISKLQSVKITATSAANSTISGSTTIWISSRPFVLFLPSTTLALTPGTPSAINVTLLATDRFWHPIALSVVGLPADVMATFSRPILKGNSDTPLTFAASIGTVPGSYEIVVVAQDTVYPALTHSQSLTLSVAGGSK